MGTKTALRAVKAVLDTNVLISRALSPRGLTAQIFSRLGEGDFEIVTSAEILDEYRAALRYESVRRRTGLSDEEIEEIIDPFAAMAVEPAIIDPTCRDPKDDRFLAAAVGGDADYIVSADDDLRSIGSFQGIRIISPGTFLRLLEAIES